MKCPHCSNLTSDIGKKCVHCGKEIQDSIQRDRRISVKCPICKIDTEIISFSGIELDYCYKCGGIWFDRGETKSFHNALSDKTLCEEMKIYLEGLSGLRSRADRSDYLKCPICSMPMSHKRFIDVSDIILDKCFDHGTWAEKDDLLSIIEIVYSGKIDELMYKSSINKQQKFDDRIKKIEAKQSRMSMEIAQNRRFSRVHLFLDFLGFT